LGRVGNFTPHLLIKGVKKTWYEELSRVMVTNLSISNSQCQNSFYLFYTNYLSPCPVRWLKYTEIYRVTGVMGVGRDSFPLVKKAAYFVLC
jgi:hypothetical protein